MWWTLSGWRLLFFINLRNFLLYLFQSSSLLFSIFLSGTSIWWIVKLLNLLFIYPNLYFMLSLFLQYILKNSSIWSSSSFTCYCSPMPNLFIAHLLRMPLRILLFFYFWDLRLSLIILWGYLCSFYMFNLSALLVLFLWEPVFLFIVLCAYVITVVCLSVQWLLVVHSSWIWDSLLSVIGWCLQSLYGRDDRG